MEDFRERSKTQCSNWNFPVSQDEQGPVWECLKGGGRTFPPGVGASLWPVPGLGCTADTRQSPLLLWEITEQTATSRRGVKQGVSSGFSEHCCRVGERMFALLARSHLSVEKLSIIPAIEPLLFAGAGDMCELVPVWRSGFEGSSFNLWSNCAAFLMVQEWWQNQEAPLQSTGTSNLFHCLLVCIIF